MMEICLNGGCVLKIPRIGFGGNILFLVHINVFNIFLLVTSVTRPHYFQVISPHSKRLAP